MHLRGIASARFAAIPPIQPTSRPYYVLPSIVAAKVPPTAKLDPRHLRQPEQRNIHSTFPNRTFFFFGSIIFPALTPLSLSRTAMDVDGEPTPSPQRELLVELAAGGSIEK